MDVRAQISYPGAGVDEVVALVLGPQFRAAVCKATLALEHEVDVRPQHDGSTLVVVRRVMPADVPDFVRRFVGETLTVVQTETWAPEDGTRQRRAQLSLQVVGQPAVMNGSLLIEETPSGVCELVRGDLKVSIPFLGKKIEAEIAKAVVAAAETEEQVGRQWLAR